MTAETTTKDGASGPPLAQPLTPDGLALALGNVCQKWQRAGAQFIGTPQAAGHAPGRAHTLTQTFDFDGVRYELVLDDQAQLRVWEWVQRPGDDQAVRRPVAHPRGLPFPRGLRRVDGYRD